MCSQLRSKKKKKSSKIQDTLRSHTNLLCGIREIERGPPMSHVYVSLLLVMPLHGHTLPVSILSLNPTPLSPLPYSLSSLCTVLGARTTEMSKTQCLPTSIYGL